MVAIRQEIRTTVDYSDNCDGVASPGNGLRPLNCGRIHTIYSNNQIVRLQKSCVSRNACHKLHNFCEGGGRHIKAAVWLADRLFGTAQQPYRYHSAVSSSDSCSSSVSPAAAVSDAFSCAACFRRWAVI